MPRDLKYGQITLEKEPQTPFADDEPVFILRAQDMLAVKTIEAYRGMCIAAGSPEAHWGSLDDVQMAFVNWQQANATKIPD